MRLRLLVVLAMIATFLTAIPITVAGAATPGDVLINEFNAKGTEWVELYNPRTVSVDITNWVLSDQEDDEVLSGTIGAGEYFEWNTELALSNDGDQIELYDADRNLIDEVAYGTKGGAPLPPFGTSSARSPNGTDSDDSARDWNVDQSPTKGVANDGPGTDLGSSIVLNEQNGFSPGGDFYELYNPTVSVVDLTGWQASDGDDIVTLSGTIAIGGFAVFTDLSISSADVMYLWDSTGVRVDQLGRVPEFENGSFQRIPDGAGPHDGYDFASSGGGVTYFDCSPTDGFENGSLGCGSSPAISLTIPEIQGSGRFSDYAGDVAKTTGVVTLFSGSGSSCWIQDSVGDANDSTSDGIFVNGCAFPAFGPKPVVGDLIEIIAGVDEQQFGNALPLTRLTAVDSIKVMSSGNDLPRPIVLTDLPKVSIPEGEAFWEPLEGMLVRVDNAPVVSPTSRFGEFAMLAKSDAKPGSGFFPQMTQILLRSIGTNEVDYNPERILVDDYTLDEAIEVMPGDRMRTLVGVVDYSFGNYKLQPASFDVKSHKLPNGDSVSKRSGPNGDTVITTFNVENLFDLVNNPDKDDASSTPTPEELEVQLAKLAMAIELELRLPEIMVLQEVENTEIAQVLGDRVNASAGTDYVAVSFETSDGRGIEVAFLYDDDRVDLEDAFQLFGPDVEDAFGPSSASPGREPLYGKFLVDGKTVHIVGNHFKSKGGDDPIFGTSFDRVTEVQRKMQAQAVRDFVDGLLDMDSKAMVMVTGDLNDFQFGEPDEGNDHPIAILEGVGGGPSFTNLINMEKEQERWTFLFDGNSQVLDHMLVNDALLKRLAGMDILHFNAAFPAALGGDPTTTLHASDHDAVEGRFTFGR